MRLLQAAKVEERVMAHPNEDLLRRGYEAFSSGDIETVLSLMADDIIWHVSESDAFPGDYHGHQEVLGLFGRVMQSSGGTYRTEIHDVLANDSHGVVLAELTAEKDGRVLTARVVQVWHLTDGKATEYWSTLDPAGALNALRD
jgi:uncharacterized protein